MDRNELPLEPRHLVVLLGASKMISEPMVRSTQTVHPSCTDTRTVSKQTKNEIPHDPCHTRVPSGSSTMISEPMVHLAQTVHLSCVKISTISKQTETRLDLSLMTKEFHWVRPKWLPSLRYVRSKQYIYLVLRLALSPNRMKRASSWALSPMSTIGCVQIDLWAYGMFGANLTPILRQD